ncbi:amidohydrolase family protein [Candidatus Bathyarchaeota archaeon]|nr:amidohydrolase family protein [Candidatus Bathyarchaeota archaeon]
MTEYDVLIRNGLIVDGSGGEPFKGELAVKDGKITEVKNTIEGEAIRVIDAGGQAVTPGFIDVHNHGDLSILYYPKADGFVRQGITTFVGGQCGDSMGPFGDYIGLPWIHSDLFTDIAPMMYVKDWLQPRDQFNERHLDLFGWEIDWRDLSEFHKKVESTGMSPNMVPMVGHGDIRSLVMGPQFDRAATPDEISLMVEETEKAMIEGCKGVTVGRDYDPGIWAEWDELIACAKASAKYDGIYASHSLRTGHRKPRRPGEHPPVKLNGVLEALNIGRETGMPIQVSHLGVLYDIVPGDNRVLMKAAIDATLNLIDEAIVDGVEADFDTIPHHLTGGIGTSPWLVHSLRPWLAIAGSPEQLANALRMPDFRKEITESICAGKHYSLNPNINPKWAASRVIVECTESSFIEKTVSKIAIESKVDELVALYNILQTDPYTKVVRRGDDDWAKMEFYKHPNAMIGVDTFAVDDSRQSRSNPPTYPNQNSFGGFPCYLRRAVRETGTMTIQEAVHKITGSPAKKFKLIDRGLLKPGFYADIAVWDPETITDTGDQIEPRKYPKGVNYVLVNGALVVDRNAHTGSLSGKVLYRE